MKIKFEMEDNCYPDSAREDSVDEDEHKLVIKEEPMYDANSSQASSCDYNLSQFKEESRFDGMDDEDEEKPMKEEPSYDEESEEDISLVSHLTIFPILSKRKRSTRS